MDIEWSCLILLLAIFAMLACADDVDNWIKDLKDPSPVVREAAARSLAHLNDTRAVELLHEVRTFPPPGPRPASQHSALRPGPAPAWPR
jgi:hypothetical protein